MIRSTIPRNLDRKTTITIADQTFIVEADDLERICDLGRGAYGIVEKMRHIPSGTIMAVKVYIVLIDCRRCFCYLTLLTNVLRELQRQ